MSERNAKASFTKRAFAEAFGVSEAQLERLFQQGMPHTKEASRRVTIPMPEGRVWYHAYLVEKGRKQAAPTSMDEARKRREIAQAELAELDLAERRNELMTVTAFDALVADVFARVRARLQNFAPRAAGLVVGAVTIQDAQARLEPLAREVMEELRRADDIPAPVEDAGDEAA